MVAYRQTLGNLGAIIATRDLDAERTEIVTLSGGKTKRPSRHSPATISVALTITQKTIASC